MVLKNTPRKPAIRQNLMNNLEGARKYLKDKEKIICSGGNELIDQNDLSRMLNSMQLVNYFDSNGMNNFNNNRNNLNNENNNIKILTTSETIIMETRDL